MAKAVHKRKHLIWLQFEQVRVHDGEAEARQQGRAESSHADSQAEGRGGWEQNLKT